MSKILIGLTGKYCSGKNYIGKLLEERGIPVLDVDALGHKVIEIERDAIIARFGNDIIGEDGLINRKTLGAKVFGRPEELSALEGIVHPGANRETLEWIKKQGRICIINAALLHKSSVFGSLNEIIIVKAPFITRILRAKKRDKLSLAAIIKRIKSQTDFYSQYLKEKTDIHIVENSVFFGNKGSALKKLKNSLDVILSRYGN